LSEAVAIIYANNFSADDLRGLIAFYKTPLGQRFLQKSAPVAQQSMLAGQRFGQSVAADMRLRIVEELRKKVTISDLMPLSRGVKKRARLPAEASGCGHICVFAKAEINVIARMAPMNGI
jgi:hypothetical protein